MSKKDLSEADICAKYITPALTGAGWDEDVQIRREISFTKGRIIVRGQLVTRGKGKRADYILYYKPNIPLAVVEAKDNSHAVGDGIQQALEYAQQLSVPFVFSSNGDGFLFHDRTGRSDQLETELALDAFPSPTELWSRYAEWKGLAPQVQTLVLQDYFDDGSGRYPHYYQQSAVNAAVEAVAKEQKRLLLVMATGTGKTYTAFQIIWRLWKAGRMKRILFLADRNILVDQTMVNDFRPFGGAMAKLSTHAKTIERAGESSQLELTLAVGKQKQVNKAFEIYLGLYQALTGPEDRQKLYKEFSPDFFDLIVVDECHRGSAAEDSAWREILEYFVNATQVGMTATPKETAYVSNIHYFGEPVYTYSLRQGILDGFLAPYKVIKAHLDVDIDGYRPAPGTVADDGEMVPDEIFSRKDQEIRIVIDERTKEVARRITEYLKESGDRFQKTIVFCVDQEHALRMRQALANANADLAGKDHRYVMRITGGDNEGKEQLDNFIDPEAQYPVLATTSRLLSTGVDAQTCRLIVIDKEIESMGEFKQIIGRGTRIREDQHKYYFTIIDFRGASALFADTDFDGPPIQIYEPGDADPMAPPDDLPNADLEISDERGADEIVIDAPPEYHDTQSGVQKKIRIKGVPVSIVREKIEYLDANGKLVTETLRDYSRKQIREHFASLDTFLQRWNASDRKQAIIEELSTECVPLDVLSDEVGKDLDPFDLVCYVAYGQKPLTRKERAGNVRKRDVFTKYGAQARKVLEALLDKYEDEGLVDLADPRILQLPPLNRMGTAVELIRAFGSRPQYDDAMHALQEALYGDAS
jgi:type I restriction enzyme R subunit